MTTTAIQSAKGHLGSGGSGSKSITTSILDNTLVVFVQLITNNGCTGKEVTEVRTNTGKRLLLKAFAADVAGGTTKADGLWAFYLEKAPVTTSITVTWTTTPTRFCDVFIQEYPPGTFRAANAAKQDSSGVFIIPTVSLDGILANDTIVACAVSDNIAIAANGTIDGVTGNTVQIDGAGDQGGVADGQSLGGAPIVVNLDVRTDDWYVVTAIAFRPTNISLPQSAQTVNAASVSTLQQQYANVIAKGNTLWCFVTTNDVTGASISVADDVNGAWTLAGVYDDATNHQKLAGFYFQNTAAGIATSPIGKPTVTATFSVASTNNGLWIGECNSASSISFDGQTGQVQASPGSGTDAITTGSATNLMAKAMVVGLSMDNRATSPVAPASGTGFTDGGAGWNFGSGNQARLESKRVTSIAAQAATFTGTAGVAPITAMMVFDEGAGPIGPSEYGFKQATLPVSQQPPLGFVKRFNFGPGIGIKAGLLTQIFQATEQPAPAVSSSGVGASTPDVSAPAVGAEMVSESGASTPSVSAPAVSNVIVSSAGTATPNATAPGVGAETVAEIGTSTPDINAVGSAAGGASTAGTASPTTNAAGIGSEVVAESGSSSPTINAPATGSEIALAAGSSAPIVSSPAVGAETELSSGSSAPIANSSAVGAEVAAGVGSGTPTIAAVAVGSSTSVSPTNVGFQPAVLPSQYQPPKAFVSSLNFGIGTRLAVAAIPLFYATSFTPPTNPSIADGTASPTASLAAVGAEIAAGAGAATPTASAPAAGKETALSPGSSAPTVLAAASGSETVSESGSSAPTVTATGTAGGSASSTGASTPDVSGLAVGKEIAVSAGSSNPVSLISVVGAELAMALSISAPSIATLATGSEIVSESGSSTPTINSTVIGSEIAVSTGASTPTSETAGVAAGGAASTGTAAPSVSTAGIGAQIFSEAGVSNPNVAGNGTGAEIVAEVGASVASAFASAVGSETAHSIGTSNPSADLLGSGLGSPAAVGSSIPSVLAIASAVSTATAIASCSPSANAVAFSTELVAEAGSSAPDTATNIVSNGAAPSHGTSSPDLASSAHGREFNACAGSSSPLANVSGHATERASGAGASTPTASGSAIGPASKPTATFTLVASNSPFATIIRTKP